MAKSEHRPRVGFYCILYCRSDVKEKVNEKKNQASVSIWQTETCASGDDVVHQFMDVSARQCPTSFNYRLQKHMFMHIKCVCVCLTDMPVVQSLSSIEGL